jgi:hypothetical protein
MQKNGSHISEYHLQVLELIGEEMVKLLTEKLGKVKISFYPFINYFREQEIWQSYKDYMPIPVIAKIFI